MKVFDDDGTELIECEHCNNGKWETECCSGAYGCTCMGGLVDMGSCKVCNGTGWRRPDANPEANIETIRGLSYAGSGPIDSRYRLE